MVKKSKFLHKLVDRFRSSRGVRVSSGKELGERSREGSEPLAVPALQKDPAKERARRKLSPKEDAVLAMGESFSELGNLLRGVQVRLEDQGGRLAGIGTDIGKLPGTAEAQLSVLKKLVEQLEKQDKVNQGLARTFGDMPEVMKGVRDSLERAAATDERTAKTLDEFKSTMGRIHGSMENMVEVSEAQANAADSLARDHKETVKHLEATTQEGLKAMRWAQEDQATRMIKLLGESGKWNRAVLVLLIMSLAALVCIFVAVINYNQ